VDAAEQLDKPRYEATLEKVNAVKLQLYGSLKDEGRSGDPEADGQREVEIAEYFQKKDELERKIDEDIKEHPGSYTSFYADACKWLEALLSETEEAIKKSRAWKEKIDAAAVTARSHERKQSSLRF
jgi:hypothetical protein